ncbi:MAG: hypothetical protein LBS77_04585 [Desulfovibrio sp.]|jgi:all-trans-retinol 13,14-reductase|nr:hypothetical protein [Desulfovibrio sp.]
MLPKESIKPAFSKRILSLEDTFSTHILFCASDAATPIVHKSNLFICKKTDITPALNPDCTPDNGPFYVSRSVPDRPDAPSKDAGLMLFALGSIEKYSRWRHSLTGQRPEEYYLYKAKCLEKFYDTLSACCPELEQIQILDGGTPLTNKDYLEAPGGGLYGTKHSLKQFSPLPATKISNLWMAGQSIIAPGILGEVVSAFVVCGFILGVKELQREIVQ